MKDEVVKQMKNISVSEVRETVKRLNPDKFDKMIIDGNSQLIISNYFFVKFSGYSATRQSKKMTFPLYPDLQNIFQNLLGGEDVHGKKKKIENDQIFKVAEQYKIDAENTDLIAQFPDVFEFPIECINGVISKEQPHYFIPARTIDFDCQRCKGEKYITCQNPDCSGRHEWDCPNCKGLHKINCTVCTATGYVKCTSCAGRGQEVCKTCNGTAELSCSHCGGDGYVGEPKEDGSNKCTLCNGQGKHVCLECTGGVVKCKTCAGKGEVICKNCNSTGKVDCLDCPPTGKITCEKCYNDKDRYGKIDCPDCRAMGKKGQLVYIETKISEQHVEKIFCKNERLSMITDEDILKNANRNGKTEACLVNLNDQKLESYDEYSEDFIRSVEKELGLAHSSYPKILKEEIYYQLIPCVRTSYRHVLTNTVHEFTVLNFFNAPVIMYHSEPEELKGGLGSAMKTTGNFFGKVFQTKSHQEKEDKKLEIKLMIYIAKADGVINEAEKEFISKQIGDLEDFTNSEKKKLFDLMNLKGVPEITKKDVDFSEHAKKEEIMKVLTSIAMVDGMMDAAEKAMIEKIRLMMKG